MSDITFRKLLEQRRLFYVLDNLALKYKKAVIDKADRKLIMDLCEGILNILNGNIKLSDNDRDKLRKYRHKLRRLVQPTDVKTRKKILKGGALLGVLIPPLISGISAIISGIASSRAQK